MELNDVLPTAFESEKVETWRRKSGDNLRELRESIGVKQGVFAERMGVSRASLSAYELCSRTPDLSFINTVSLVTGCSASYLLGQSSVMTNEYAPLEDALGIDQRHAQRLFDLYWGTCAARELLDDPNLLKAVQIMSDMNALRKCRDDKEYREFILWQAEKSMHKAMENALKVCMRGVQDLDEADEEQMKAEALDDGAEVASTEIAAVEDDPFIKFKRNLLKAER